MKGVLFNIVQEVVEDLYGSDTWDDLLDDADVEGAYTALGDYASSELAAIVAAASVRTGLDPEAVLRLIGRLALPRLLRRLPSGVEHADEPLAFVRSVNDIIHPEVLKLYPAARPPVFDCESTPDGLVVHYRSSRNLPDLAHGLLEAVDDQFEQSVVVQRLADDCDANAVFLVRVDVS
ncbi:MAG: heme NO-binding domain-containing protein [Acidimicrobiia bacterium]|nr:heme NO-binding domain-containing protein [Acidimicrobiia bacterium]